MSKTNNYSLNLPYSVYNIYIRKDFNWFWKILPKTISGNNSFIEELNVVFLDVLKIFLRVNKDEDVLSFLKSLKDYEDKNIKIHFPSMAFLLFSKDDYEGIVILINQLESISKKLSESDKLIKENILFFIRNFFTESSANDIYRSLPKEFFEYLYVIVIKIMWLWDLELDVLKEYKSTSDVVDNILNKIKR